MAEAPPLAGVLGDPIGHSLSPLLHNHWLAHYALPGRYVHLQVKAAELPAALNGLKALGFRGGNVTVPHKEAALALVDEADAAARRIGAVNTLVIAADGCLIGRNTDAYGFLANLQNGAAGFAADAGPALVLGAGGAARAVLAALIDAGCPQLRLSNRTEARAQALRHAFGPTVTVVPWQARVAALDGAALVVNTTSLGMTGQAPLDLDLTPLPRSALVTDIVYAPLVTPLLAAAAARGNPTVDGLGMLLHQAVPGFAAWFGVRPEVTAELRALVLRARGEAA